MALLKKMGEDKKQTVVSKIIESVFAKKYSKDVEKQIEKFFADDAMLEEKELALKKEWDKMEVNPSWLRNKIRYRHLKRAIRKESGKARGNMIGVIGFASIAFLMIGVGGWFLFQQDRVELQGLIVENIEPRQEVIEEVIDAGVPTESLEQLPKQTAQVKQVPISAVENIVVPKESELVSVVNHGPKERLVVLDDGSRVTLYANSQIKYSRNFLEKDIREVTLAGAGRFEVAKESGGKQFVVVTEALCVNVLGTVFDVEAYGWSDEILVALYSGSVGIKVGEREEIRLNPNDKLIYSRSDGSVEVDKIADDKGGEKDWKNGPLIFEAMTADMIFRAISARFELEVELEQSVKNDDKIYYARFDQGVKIDEVLVVLKEIITSAEMEFVGEKLVVQQIANK